MSITSRINEMSTHIEQAYDELQGLGADLTNVNKNIENISMVLDDIYDSMPQVSGEGTSLTLEDTRVGKIKSTLKGNTSQTGTPTPTTPIPVNVVSGDNEINVCGKNLCKIEAHTYQDLSRAPSVGQPLPLFNTNGTIKIKIDLSTFDKSKAYTVSARNDITNLRCFYCDSNDLYISSESTGNPKTLSIPTNASILYIFIKISNVTDLTPVPLEDYELQIEKGPSATEYEPYQGNTYNIDLPVENLLQLPDGSKTTNGITATITNGKLKIVGTTTTNWFSICNLNIPLESGTYTFSYTNKKVFRYNLSLRYEDNTTGTIYGNTDRNTPITLSQKATITGMSSDSNTVGATFNYEDCLMIEKGTKANTYTPYGTTPIELCKIGNYQDYFYKDSGKWYLHKEIGKVVLNGSESGWSYPSANRFNLDNVVDNYLKRQDYITYLSNYYEAFKQSIDNSVFNTLTTNTNYGFNLSSTPANNYTIRIKDTRYTSMADFKSCLSTNNVKIYYILATPTNTQITYQPLLDQLNLLEKAMSKDSQTNISQVNNDLPFIISASALKKWSV